MENYSSAMEQILVVDFGSQYTQLIARRLREQFVYCEIIPFHLLVDYKPHAIVRGLILSGGPYSVYQEGAPLLTMEEVKKWNCPVLGICYGAQLLAHLNAGKVLSSETREYGSSFLKKVNTSHLFEKVNLEKEVWMSHSDSISQLTETKSRLIAKTHKGVIAAFESIDSEVPYWGIQFHPEVSHSSQGEKILRNFAFNICQLKEKWTMSCFLESSKKEIKERVGSEEVILGLSGGVDSTVVAVLMQKAIDKQLHCIFVDNGLLRQNERESVETMFKDHYCMDLTVVDASEIFLKALEGVTDPEEKRKIIGKVFIDVFQKEKEKFHKSRFLAQGTLYPDIIESYSVKGPSATIKSHHNVGGLPKDVQFELIEPLRFLFKDEVRKLGKEMKIPNELLGRHPFPGPGLAIRIMGEVTEERLSLLRKADLIFIEEIKNHGLYDYIWQAFVVFLPVCSVGVMGDERTYEYVVSLRAITSQDGMTADWYSFEKDFLTHVSNRIIRETKGINRVVYDISSKPPATIEWE